ncbi:response regulator [Christiangramia aquimixticola]|uniref:response regulator n=1 Tax=Christiangramia aquimixticola TaxID=1697558 RepID=UPI003AA86E8D
MNIAVIDDDEVYQMIIRKYIDRSQSFEEAEFFLRPLEALEYFRENRDNLPSLILLDINMPLMDGWQFLEALEKEYEDLYEKTKVYVVSSSIAYSDRDKLEEFPGLSGFLSKPIGITQLQELREAI